MAALAIALAVSLALAIAAVIFVGGQYRQAIDEVQESAADAREEGAQ